MGAVCFPKCFSPHQRSCLCCLFVLSVPKNTCTFAHSLTCRHLQIVCSQSSTPRNVQPSRSLVQKCNLTLACTAQAHKHCYTLGCIDAPTPCARMPGRTSTQSLCTHRKPTGANLHLSVCPSTRLCTHTGQYAHMSTQVLTYMLGRVRDSGGPLASSKDDTIPSSLWSCPEI